MGERSWSSLLGALIRKEELSTSDTAWAMGQIMAGDATPAQIAGFVVALRAKGETPAEIAGLVEAMLAAATPVRLAEEVRTAAVDIVGTGGDQAHTVNISTMAALVVAGCGVPVAKHGNRAASSSCGTADVLETLGVPLSLGPTEVARCVTEVGIGFCFAARFHPGMRHAGAPRRELGIPTAFNFLGPLTNPARPTAATVGCADLRMAPVMARVFAQRGDCVLLVRGEDGLDEVTTAAPTTVWVVHDGQVRQVTIDPVDLGIPRCAIGDLRGGDVLHNAAVVRQVLSGTPGPIQDAVLVNAAAALAARSGDVADDDRLHRALLEGLERARESISSGAAQDLLDRWVGFAKVVV